MKYVFSKEELKEIRHLVKKGCDFNCDNCIFHTILNGDCCGYQYIGKGILDKQKDGVIEIKKGDML